MLLDDGRDQARIGVVVLCRAGDGVIEVGLHLEETREVRIVRGQQIIKLPVAEQDDLHIEWNGLGIEALRGYEAGRLGWVLERNARGIEAWAAYEAGRLGWLLDANLAPLDGALQGLPGKGRQQQPARIQ